MNSSRVGIYRITRGESAEAVRRAENEMLPMLREQPGFVAYELITTVDSGLISISTWRTQSEADAAVVAMKRWVEGSMSDLLATVESHIGDVAFRHLASRT